jgi:hypothetical protein
MKSKAYSFVDFLESEENIYWWFPFFFFIGFLFIGSLAFGYKKRLPKINILVGVILIALSGLAMWVAGLYKTERIMVGDICEENYMIVSYDVMPFVGEGIGFYFSCMSAVILTTDLLIFRNLKLVLGHRSMKI